MKNRIIALVFIFSFIAAEALAEQPRFSMKSSDTSEPQATYNDIKNTLGIVPSFLSGYPAESIPGAWRELKGLQMSPNTALPPKCKELIGLAVASQIPCSYCTLFHQEAAKLNGATPDETKEAIAVASTTRHWSTFFNGMQQDQAAFRSEVDRMLAKANEQSSGAPAADAKTEPASSPIETADAAYKDIEAAFGFVPTFAKEFPPSGIAGAWEDAKSLMLSSNTALPAKYKDLVSLAVSSQIPCANCIYWDTKAAQMDGATEAEIHEAVAVAGLVRKWSTVLNGLRVDEAVFKQEMNQIVAHAKAEQQKTKSK